MKSRAPRAARHPRAGTAIRRPALRPDIRRRAHRLDHLRGHRSSVGRMSEDVRPFTVHIPDDVLADLRERLARTRWPDQIPGSDWGYGTDIAYLQELCEYWRSSYDWRKSEAVLNQWAALDGAGARTRAPLYRGPAGSPPRL